MKTTDAINSFGSVAALARNLGISTAAVYQWGDTVPPLRAYQIQDLLAKKAEQPQHKEAA